MRTVIISGGRIERDFALSFLENETFEQFIAVDNGLRFCYDNQIKPTWIVGDFDTAAPELVEYYQTQTDIPIRRFNPVKDSTDSQIAIELALELGSSEITLLGGTGTRMDHVLGNIQSLMLAKKKGVSCVILDEYNRIQLIDGETRLKKSEQYGKYVSLLPLTTEVTGVDLTGFKFNLTGHTFTSTGSAGLGVSNEIIEDTAEIRVKSGIFVLIESRDLPKRSEISEKSNRNTK
ncbi:thiamine diphosphokinase [Laedolimicola intestinihominis]|uniref:Thiamine diphosphokinase n=1 Tax=Laedolimicola intestinihominis TaxID=3133166 RepID=A0ABV1FC54_9FIRM